MKMAILSAVLMASAVLAQDSPPSAEGSPRIVIESTEQDLGIIKKSAGATHTFRFRNEGTGPLEIIQVVPG
ncbi:MAG: DUF1573 domain-containing protein [Acidobacteria bacterium]|nr:DUF1573 domain-containing protein [Acidobacteriota bacterium]